MGLKAFVKDISVTFLRNWKGSILLVEHVTRDEAWEVLKFLKAYMRDHEMKIRERSIYPSLESPAWKRLQNAAVSRALEVARSLFPHGAPVADYAAGEIWASDEMLGRYNRWQSNRAPWVWSKDAAGRLGLNFEELESKFEEFER